MLVSECLLFVETKIKERGSSSGTELKALTSKQVKRGPKCYHWGRNGHIKWYCRLLHEDTKENYKKYSKKKAFFSKKKCKASPVVLIDCVGFLTHHTLMSNVGKNNWIVDSGATCHICHDVRSFINLKKLETAEEITLSDGYSVEALRIGSIKLNVSVPDRNYQNTDCMRHYMFPNCLTTYWVHWRLQNLINHVYSLTQAVKLLMIKE